MHGAPATCTSQAAKKAEEAARLAAEKAAQEAAALDAKRAQLHANGQEVATAAERGEAAARATLGLLDTPAREAACEANASAQEEELMVLEAIFGEEGLVREEGALPATFTLRVDGEGADGTPRTVALKVSYLEEYPSHLPPTVELVEGVPDEDKAFITNSLHALFYKQACMHASLPCIRACTRSSISRHACTPPFLASVHARALLLIRACRHMPARTHSICMHALCTRARARVSTSSHAIPLLHPGTHAPRAMRPVAFVPRPLRLDARRLHACTDGGGDRRRAARVHHECLDRVVARGVHVDAVMQRHACCACNLAIVTGPQLWLHF